LLLSITSALSRSSSIQTGELIVTFFQDFIYCLLFCGIRAKSDLPDLPPLKHEEQRQWEITEVRWDPRSGRSTAMQRNDSEESFK
jgi:hypothetical protein